MFYTKAKLHEACGIFGIYAPGEDVARITFFALFALQHRGQESAGIATSDGKRIQNYARMGLVSQVFSEESLSQLTGNIAIGHNRYSTTGSSRICNAQPIVVGSGDNVIGVAQCRHVRGEDNRPAQDLKLAVRFRHDGDL